MKATQLAEKECTNLAHGKCLGVRPDNSPIIKNGESMIGKPCCIGSGSCDYFENVIIPLAVNNTEYTGAIQDYFNSINSKELIRNCERCKKLVFGLKKNEKFCTDCKQRNKRDSNRKAQKRFQTKKSTTVSSTI